MLQAYSREPRSLLGGGAADLMTAGAARARQPVAYRHPVHLLASPTTGQQQEEEEEVVTVDWVHGGVVTFASYEDFVNRVPHQTRADALAPTPPEHADVYVRETIAFLMRGHSLFHARCTCEPPRARASLGVNTSTNSQQQQQHPPCEKKKRKRQPPPPACPLLLACNNHDDDRGATLKDIERELGVRDLRGCALVHLGEGRRAHHHVPLLRVLIELAGLRRLAPDRLGLPPPSATAGSNNKKKLALASPLLIRGAEHIEAMARRLAPRPYVYVPAEFDAVTQRLLGDQLCAAAAARRLRILQADNDNGDQQQQDKAYAIFWNGDAAHLEPFSSTNSNSTTSKEEEEFIIGRLRALWNLHCDRSRRLLPSSSASASALKQPQQLSISVVPQRKTSSLLSL